MIKFSLSHILNESPYDLTLQGDSFTFVTELGAHYSVGFVLDDMAIGDCDTYQFILRRIENAGKQYDPKVEETILAIVREFFRSNLYVLLYMCDTSDGRESVRNRLFTHWFEKYADKESFTLCKAHATVEREGMFFCIIVDNRNPRLREIVSDFEEKANILTSDKPQ